MFIPIAGWALPDLTLEPSDIEFSISSPEVSEVLTISAKIRNNDTTYHDQVVATPIAFKDNSNVLGTATWGRIHLAGASPTWVAQRYVPTADVNVGRIDFFITDLGVSDDIRMEVRRTLNANPPIPSPSESDRLDHVSLDSVFSSTSADIEANYGWQQFISTAPLSFSAFTTYWFCLENFNVSAATDGYGVWRDVYPTSTGENFMAASFNGGFSWTQNIMPSNNRSIYHRIYKVQDTIVRLYEGDPDSGGILFAVSTITIPVVPGMVNTVISSTRSFPAAGTYNIYVQIDGPALINESNETNNKISRPINVVQTQSRVSAASAPDGALGIDPTKPPTFTFNKAMNESTLDGAFSLKAVRNDNGETIAESVTGNIVYDAASKVATFTPASPLRYNYRYQASWSTSAQDYLGFSLAAYSASFQTAIRKSVQSMIIGMDQQTTLTIDAGAVPYETFFIDLNIAPSVTAAIQIANNKTAHDRDAFTVPVLSSLRQLTLYEGTYPGTAVASPDFSNDVRLTVPYTDNGAGYLAGTSPPVKEDSLSLYWLNEEDGLWVRLPDSAVDTSANTVTAKVPHLSYFVLMGLNAPDLTRAYAYPVPFRPNAGLGHTKIKFAGLSSQCVIKIYTPAGELVKTIEESDGDGFNDSWDASDVASGAYIYIVDNGSERKTGQLVIVK